jgi:hypothetical protein
MVNTITSAGSAGFHTFQSDLTMGYKVPISLGFLYNYFAKAKGR